MKNWHNINDLNGYEVYSKQYGFAGRLVDKHSKTINILGMPQDELGFSYERNETEEKVKKEYEDIIKLVNQGNQNE